MDLGLGSLLYGEGNHSFRDFALGMQLLYASMLSLTVVTVKLSYHRKQLSVAKPRAEPLESLPVLVQVPSALPKPPSRLYGPSIWTS
jgi:hypothetical protein